MTKKFNASKAIEFLCRILNRSNAIYTRPTFVKRPIARDATRQRGIKRSVDNRKRKAGYTLHEREQREKERGSRAPRYCSLSRTFNATARRVYKHGTNEPCQQDNAQASSLLHVRRIRLVRRSSSGG